MERKLGIVAFAFGTPAEIHSNELIAQISEDISFRNDWAPIFTQADVPILECQERKLAFVAEEPGYPPPTLRIARAAVRWAGREGINELIAVAASPHMRRVLRDLRASAREAKEEITIIASERIRRFTEGIWFSPLSTQTRTRSKMAWSRREWILMMLPMFLYKRVAG